MCRFLIYRGKAILMADLITKPRNSLITQSYDAKERIEPLNGDGFGVGWYVPEIDSTPCLFTSTTPAWSNRNLCRLAEKTVSPNIFAHIRAATPGILVSDVNCHPFQFGKFLWMHNGHIAGFQNIKRRIRSSLSDDIYHFIQGTTDSEHAFALFLDQLNGLSGDISYKIIQKAMKGTIKQLNEWSKEANVSDPSFYNFAMTDGQTIIVTRYVNDPARQPASLYISRGERYECRDGFFHMINSKESTQAVIIASEPLTVIREEWEKVPKNHMVIVTSELKIKFIEIDV